MTDSVDYTDGRWVATTMGHFIQILVDSGHDPAIIFRVEEDSQFGTEEDGAVTPDDDSFIRKMTVYSVPNGAVLAMMKELGFDDDDEPHAVYKLLLAFIKGGLVK